MSKDCFQEISTYLCPSAGFPIECHELANRTQLHQQASRSMGAFRSSARQRKMCSQSIRQLKCENSSIFPGMIIQVQSYIPVNIFKLKCPHNVCYDRQIYSTYQDLYESFFEEGALLQGFIGLLDEYLRLHSRAQGVVYKTVPSYFSLQQQPCEVGWAKRMTGLKVTQ